MLGRNEWAALRAKDQGAGLGGRWGRFSERVACRDWFVQGASRYKGPEAGKIRHFETPEGRLQGKR